MNPEKVSQKLQVYRYTIHFIHFIYFIHMLQNYTALKLYFRIFQLFVNLTLNELDNSFHVCTIQSRLKHDCDLNKKIKRLFTEQLMKY